MKLTTDELPYWSLINLSMLLYLQSHDWWHTQEHGISFDFPVENKSTKRKSFNLFGSADMSHHSFKLSKNMGDILLIGVWTSDKTLSVSCLAYYDSGFLYQRKPSFSLMWYLFSESGYQIKLFHSCLTYFFPAFRYEMKHSFSCLIYYFSELGHQMKHFMSCLI